MRIKTVTPDRSEKARLVPERLGWAVALALGALAILWGPTPVATLGALAFVVAASRAPLPALCLIVVSLPFYLLDRHFGHLEFSPTEIFIVLAALAGTARLAWNLATGRIPPLSSLPGQNGWGLSKRGRDLFGDPVVVFLVVLFVLAGLLSLTASVAIHESERSFRTIIVEPAVFFILVVTQVRDRRGAYALALALVLAGVAISLVGFWQYATDQSIITAEDGLRRIRGFYGSPNNLGLFLGRALPMAVGLGLWAKSGRWLLAVAAAIMALALLLTFSIGAWVAVAISLLVIAALRGRQAFKVALGAGGLGVVVFVAAAIQIPRIGSHLNLGAGTSLERVLVWRSALRMLAGHAVRGIGLDNFLYYYQHGYRLPAAWREPDLSHPHNLVLDFWLSLGLPGILLIGLLLGRFVEVVIQEWRRRGALERALYAGTAGAMVDTVAHGLVDNSFFLVDLSVLFWLLFAIVATLRRSGETL